LCRDPDALRLAILPQTKLHEWSPDDQYGQQLTGFKELSLLDFARKRRKRLVVNCLQSGAEDALGYS
jgi:hypothetical protein